MRDFENSIVVENKTSEELIEFMKILAEPARLKILQMLYHKQELSVSELVSILQISQPTLSQHLKTLRMANFVTYNRRGKYNYYSLDRKGIRKMYGNGIDFLANYFINNAV